jgi:hypothetical protein
MSELFDALCLLGAEGEGDRQFSAGLAKAQDDTQSSGYGG